MYRLQNQLTELKKNKAKEIERLEKYIDSRCKDINKNYGVRCNNFDNQIKGCNHALSTDKERNEKVRG